MTFQDYIETRRKALGLSHRDIGKKTDSTQQNVHHHICRRSDIEVGRAIKIVEAMGLDPKTEFVAYFDSILTQAQTQMKTEHKVKALIDWIKNLDKPSIDLVFAEYIGEDDDDDNDDGEDDDDDNEPSETDGRPDL